MAGRVLFSVYSVQFVYYVVTVMSSRIPERKATIRKRLMMLRSASVVTTNTRNKKKKKKKKTAKCTQSKNRNTIRA